MGSLREHTPNDVNGAIDLIIEKYEIKRRQYYPKNLLIAWLMWQFILELRRIKELVNQIDSLNPEK